MEIQTGRAKSSINHLPIGDSVIIKRITKHSVIEINGSKDEQDLIRRANTEFIKFEVAAYGEATHTIEIGDSIQFDFNALLSEVRVKDNPKSFTKIKELLKDSDITKVIMQSETPNMLIDDIGKFEMWSYFRLSFYNIYSIIKD